MIIHDMPQRSPEWFQVRLGKLTASRASDMLATIKSGEAAARRDLRMQIVCERLTGQSQEDTYINAAMQRGIDKEADALAAYEALTGNLVSPVGFIAHDTLPVGCSPDGLISGGGGLELKCPKTATHIGYLTNKAVPRDYLGQIQMSLWLTGFDWWDFVSFDDRLPEPLRLFHVRVQRADVDLKAFELLVRMFLGECDRQCEELTALAGAAA